MSKTDSNELAPEQGQLVNIYDRLASLGRAMQKATKTAQSVHTDKTTEHVRPNLEAGSPK